MALFMVLALDEVRDTTVRYVERAEGKPSIIGTLEIGRWALPETVPSQMRLTLEFHREAQASAEGTAVATSETTEASQASLSTGDKVTIVKNRLAGIKYPPEWLAEYLGKTGVVLWTTLHGAMVQLAGGATWFSYEELKIEE